MDIYTLRSDGAYVSYSGTSQAQVTAMLAANGLTCQFIDRETFDAAVAAAQGY